jgi:ABC-2 type transport system permease protein
VNARVFWRDTATLAARTLRHNIRSFDTIATVLVMPASILLTFVYVLGGAMDIPGERYVDYIVPVVLLFTIASGVSYTAFRVNADVAGGMYARLRTMPIAQGAIVGGHVVASWTVNAVSVGAIWLVAFLIGYRPRADATAWGISLALIALVLVAFTAMGVAFSLASRSAEGAAAFTYPLIGLLLTSSGFAPTNTMPTALRTFADLQPMTPIVNAIRDAQLGVPCGQTTWTALAWTLALAVGFGVLAHVAARRAAQPG